jgi:hypothetical protein
MTMPDASNTDGDEPTDGDKPAETETKPEAAPAEKPKAASKPLIGRTTAVGIGIGSAALVAALLYASRHKPGAK